MRATSASEVCKSKCDVPSLQAMELVCECCVDTTLRKCVAEWLWNDGNHGSLHLATVYVQAGKLSTPLRLPQWANIDVGSIRVSHFVCCSIFVLLLIYSVRVIFLLLYRHRHLLRGLSMLQEYRPLFKQKDEELVKWAAASLFCETTRFLLYFSHD